MWLLAAHKLGTSELSNPLRLTKKLEKYTLKNTASIRSYQNF